MTVEIRQAEASVKMLEMLVPLRRAPEHELTEARERLAALRGAVVAPAEQEDRNEYFERVALERREAEHREQPVVPTSDLVARKAQVLADADALKRQEAELSNRLHQVPEGETCAELCAEIIALRQRIEGKWTEYRFMERNGRVLDAEPEPVVVQRSGDLLQAERDRQRLADERSKLRKKLADPRKSVAKEVQWTQRLAVVELEIEAKDLTIRVLRG